VILHISDVDEKIKRVFREGEVLIMKCYLRIYICLLILIFVSGIAIAASTTTKSQTILKGGVGSGSGKFGFKVLKDGSCISPSAIAIDTTGNIYIADSPNDRIQKFDSAGKFISLLKYPILERRYEQTIDDIATDDNNNLYVASRHEGKISKYSADGRFLMSVKLDDKDLRWSDKQGWHSGSLQINRIAVDVNESIYLEGVRELIKFDKGGNVDKKWAPVDYDRAAIFILDPMGNMFLNKQGEAIEQYDKHGRLLERKQCGELHSWRKDGHCFTPQYVDKNGYLYWFEENGRVVIKANRDENRVGEMRIPSVDVYGNTVKFDQNGNVYILRNTNSEIWVEKYSW
jgi:tripartite motif-containing protein 71